MLAMGTEQLSTTLYDMPTIIESHRTFDSKQFYKINDICQVLVEDVEADRIVPPEKRATSGPEQYQWPHGLSAPLKNVRKRRFRKRVSKVVQDIGEEVDRLLLEDDMAEEVRASACGCHQTVPCGCWLAFFFF